MYRYSIVQKKNTNGFLTNLGLAIFLMLLLHPATKAFGPVVGFSMMTLLIASAMVLADKQQRSGKFVADNRYAHSLNEVTSPREHYAAISDERVLSAVLKQLTGTPIAPMPFGRSVWKLGHFNKEMNEIYLVLEWHDPFLKNFSNSRIALKVAAELYPNRVKLTTKYAVPTPLRLRQSRHIITATENSIIECLRLLEKGESDTLPLITEGVEVLTENVSSAALAPDAPPSAVPVLAPPGLNYSFFVE